MTKKTPARGPGGKPDSPVDLRPEPLLDAAAKFARDVRAPWSARAQTWTEIRTLIACSSWWGGGVADRELSSFELTTHADYRNALERGVRGSVSPLNGEDVQFWAISSGSTGAPKYFPMTHASHAAITQSLLVDNYFLLGEFPECCQKPILFSVALDEPPPVASLRPMGGVSNYYYRTSYQSGNGPFPVAVLGEKDPFWLWAYALGVDIHRLYGLVPAVLLGSLRRIEARRAEYAEVVSGARQAPVDFGQPIEMDASRRDYLLERLRGTQPLTFRDLWPHLSLVTCWTHGPSSAQLPALRSVLGPGVTLRGAGYTATEGVLSIVTSAHERGGTVTPYEIVEFLPPGAEALASSLLQSWELEEGAVYEPVITTHMGLVRYRMNELVRCTGFSERMARIEYHGRLGREVRLGFANVGEVEVVRAAEMAGFFGEGDWFVCPNPSHDGFVLYTREGFERRTLDLEAFENGLKSINPMYGEESYLRPLVHQTLKSTHPSWLTAAPQRVQGKPRFLMAEPLENGVGAPSA